MGHLRTLRVIHWVFAVFLTIAALLFVLLWCVAGIALIRRGEPVGWLFFLGGVLVAALLSLTAAMHVRAASAAPRGERRILQTGLAMMHLMNFPVGTAFAVYVVWLCWFNPETKLHFDTHDSRL